MRDHEEESWSTIVSEFMKDVGRAAEHLFFWLAGVSYTYREKIPANERHKYQCAGLLVGLVALMGAGAAIKLGMLLGASFSTVSIIAVMSGAFLVGIDRSVLLSLQSTGVAAVARARLLAGRLAITIVVSTVLGFGVKAAIFGEDVSQLTASQRLVAISMSARDARAASHAATEALRTERAALVEPVSRARARLEALQEQATRERKGFNGKLGLGPQWRQDSLAVEEARANVTSLEKSAARRIAAIDSLIGVGEAELERAIKSMSDRRASGRLGFMELFGAVETIASSSKRNRTIAWIVVLFLALLDAMPALLAMGFGKTVYAKLMSAEAEISISVARASVEASAAELKLASELGDQRRHTEKVHARMSDASKTAELERTFAHQFDETEKDLALEAYAAEMSRAFKKIEIEKVVSSTSTSEKAGRRARRNQSRTRAGMTQDAQNLLAAHRRRRGANLPS